MDTLTKLFAGYSIGADAYDQVERFCSPFGTRVLLVGGETGLSKGKPLLEDAMDRAGSGLTIIDTVIYGKECTYERIHEIRDAYRDAEIDMVFGMGGGKAMDTAKGAAWELGVPVFTFPTIPSNCSSMAALSVVYRPDGCFDSFYFYERPAIHCFINTTILANAPVMYLRAGMGDTVAKCFECHFSARGDELDYHSALGKEISRLCYERIRTYSGVALAELERGKAGESFLQIVLTIIVNTGLVSHLVEDCYNCAVAHSVCYGLELLPGLAEQFLHGDRVGYGLLVELMMDDNMSFEVFTDVRAMLAQMGIPVTLDAMGIPLRREVLEPVIRETLAGPDMEHIPCPVTGDMIWRAMCRVEEAQC